MKKLHRRFQAFKYLFTYLDHFSLSECSEWGSLTIAFHSDLKITGWPFGPDMIILISTLLYFNGIVNTHISGLNMPFSLAGLTFWNLGSQGWLPGTPGWIHAFPESQTCQ